MVQAQENSLQVIDLFSELPAAKLDELEQCCRWVRLGPNKTVFNRDTHDRDIYFVVHDGVQIVNYSSAGREIWHHDEAGGGAAFYFTLPVAS